MVLEPRPRGFKIAMAWGLEVILSGGVMVATAWHKRILLLVQHPECRRLFGLLSPTPAPHKKETEKCEFWK